MRKAPFAKKNLDKISNRELFEKNYQIEMEPPHEYLNKTNGFFQFEREDVPISTDNILLRGCQLRNCK